MNVKSIFFYQKKHNPAGYVATNVIIMREYSDKYYGSYIYIYQYEKEVFIRMAISIYRWAS